MNSSKQIRKGLLSLAALPVLFAAFVSPARAQGPAPETAPSLFSRSETVSYDSVFTTRAPVPDLSGAIPPTSRPTFSHQGIFNFTWGFYRNLDVAVILPIATNRFQMTGANAPPTVGGTGLGDIS